MLAWHVVDDFRYTEVKSIKVNSGKAEGESGVMHRREGEGVLRALVNGKEK